MSTSDVPREFFDRVNAGTESAEEELYHQYFERLCRAAARLIGERLERQYSAEDAAQSALGSFFRGMVATRYQLDNSARLWRLLVTILRNKIRKRGQKARESPLDGDIMSRDPPHEEVVTLADAIEAAIAGLKSRHLEICRLFYYQNLSPAEIAARVGCSRWTVRRVLNEFGHRLQEILDKRI